MSETLNPISAESLKRIAETRKGRLSAEAALRGGKKTRHGKASTTMYQVTFFVDGEFGTPGAVAVKNGNRNDQFFLRHVRLDLAEDRSIHFDCNSWVYPYKKTTSDRVFFINTVNTTNSLQTVILHPFYIIIYFDFFYNQTYLNLIKFIEKYNSNFNITNILSKYFNAKFNKLIWCFRCY
jgi:hypothetical protein